MDPALETLLKKERSLWRGRDQYYSQETLSTGHAALDKQLPAGGWSLGALTELLTERDGIGEFSLLMPALREITNGEDNKQWAALINPPYAPYAPALTNAGLNLDYLLVVDSGNDKDTFWSAEQLLRSGTFKAVILWIRQARDSQNANRLRRLQLAAEHSGAWAVAYRDASAAAQHSPAALRISLQPSSKQLSESHENGLVIELIKARGGSTGQLHIAARDFDALQGAEWPGFNKEA